jgi:hypothetical protein
VGASNESCVTCARECDLANAHLRIGNREQRGGWALLGAKEQGPGEKPAAKWNTACQLFFKVFFGTPANVKNIYQNTVL